MRTTTKQRAEWLRRARAKRPTVGDTMDALIILPILLDEIDRLKGDVERVLRSTYAPLSPVERARLRASIAEPRRPARVRRNVLDKTLDVLKAARASQVSQKRRVR